MRKQSLLLFCSGVAIIAATVFVVTARDPEQMRVESSDHRVTVSGYTRSSLPFLLRDQGPAAGAPLREDVYHIEPDTMVLEAPADIQFSLDALVNIDGVELYRYDTALLMWERMESTKTSSFVETTSQRLGLFALGNVFRVDAPSFLTSLDALRAKAPAGTVGYQIATGVRLTQEESPLIRLVDQTESGGCGGVIGVGEHEEFSETQQEATLLVNDVATPVTVVLRARWFVAKDGCPQGKPLLPQESVIK